MKRFVIITIIAYVLSLYNVYCQDGRSLLLPRVNMGSEGKFGADNFMRRINDKALMTKGTDIVDYEGSPYLVNEFDSAELITFDKVYKGLSARYNIYSDEIEVLNAGVVYAIMPDKKIKCVSFTNRKLIVDFFQYKRKKVLGFLEVVEEGNADLVAKKVVVYRERQEPSGMQYSVLPPKYERLSDQLFARFGEGQLYSIRTLKNFLSMVPDSEIELQEFAANANLTNRPEDIIILVKYYNKLKKNSLDHRGAPSIR